MPAIVRWSPWRELEAMQRRLGRIFDELELAPASVPAADVYETDGEVVVELEAPGFEEKELDVEVSDHTLVVKGERQEEQEKKNASFWCRERLERTFERRFVLPADVKTDDVSASFSKGVLRVRVPKRAEAKPRKVEISKS